MSQSTEYLSGLAKYTLKAKDLIMTKIEEEFVLLLREYIRNVPIYVEFPIKLARAPIIVLTVHNVEAKNLGLGNVVGKDSDENTIYGIIWDFTISIDVWALDTKTRDDIISAIQVLIMTTKELLKNRVGVIDSYITSSQERGFDMTDRIIQYASHQITDIQRQILNIETAVMTTYTPVVEYGWLQSIIFKIGQYSQTFLNETIYVEETFTVPNETGLAFDEIGIVIPLLKLR